MSQDRWKTNLAKCRALDNWVDCTAVLCKATHLIRLINVVRTLRMRHLVAVHGGSLDKTRVAEPGFDLCNIIVE